MRQKSCNPSPVHRFHFIFRNAVDEGGTAIACGWVTREDQPHLRSSAPMMARRLYHSICKSWLKLLLQSASSSTLVRWYLLWSIRRSWIVPRTPRTCTSQLEPDGVDVHRENYLEQNINVVARRRGYWTFSLLRKYMRGCGCYYTGEYLVLYHGIWKNQPTSHSVD